MSAVQNHQRHYGMDWLRIAAFGLLILYHIGLYFVPWPWHINRAEPLQWVAVPLMAMNSWRLLLLFLVSGYATAAILSRQSASFAFVKERTARLMVPVLFAMVVIIPVQPWIELRTHTGYSAGFWQFWISDYWAFSAAKGMVLPTWQHLWFVCYLWAFTLALVAALSAIPAAWRARMQGLTDQIFAGWRVIAVPIALFVALVLWRGVNTVRLDSWAQGGAAVAVFFGCMLFGYYLYRAEAGWVAIRRLWPQALAIAGVAFAVILVLKWRFGAGVEPFWVTLSFALARPIHGWATIIALIGIADRFGNRDHTWRAPLTEAVFPFYIIHQTIIVGVAFLILPYALSAGIEFAVLFSATAVGCWLFYRLGRSISLLRPLIGLRK